jgi:hypothetical protein
LFQKVLFVYIPVRNTETNQKMLFSFAKQTEKQLKQIEFWFEPKKIDCFYEIIF